METFNQSVQLADGNELPLLGFGTYLLESQEQMDAAIKTAFEAGYHLFDTAQLYRNEDLLGDSLIRLQIPRNQVFITSKIAELSQGYQPAIDSIDDSLKRLKTDYLDLVLVHWPVHEHFFETWQALEQLKKDGKVRSIGVSNYTIAHLELLATQATEMPVVNQIERHPLLTQQPMVAYDTAHNIVTQAWSPLGRGVVLNNPMLKKMADHHTVSVAQLVLKWQLAESVAVIPKSKTTSRIIENHQLDFDLSEDEIGMIDLLNKNQRTGNEPELVYELGKQY
ncbi:aldo keto reductase [Secundilactobacillus kimchicus JCM 15530]|uniref:Aldo keto reductase n=1 Tax=Secundilactobacillus kimchicus JCM 15530 TaxID=1302272 RepID=A0A0R1HK85_9LACO|nr:aldo/keto reductase [Secundilactobacillus kimchicus]KRK46924.1 aldo keto reductase [Secundilactobacillus kimchicus JCM 15530]